MRSESVNIKRPLKIDLPKGQSAFLWGPRKTGKMSYLLQRFPDSTRYDLLQTDVFFRFSKEPYLFDVGITGGLMKRSIGTNRGAEFGNAFENFNLMELPGAGIKKAFFRNRNCAVENVS